MRSRMYETKVSTENSGAGVIKKNRISYVTAEPSSLESVLDQSFSPVSPRSLFLVSNMYISDDSIRS